MIEFEAADNVQQTSRTSISQIWSSYEYAFDSFFMFCRLAASVNFALWKNDIYGTDVCMCLLITLTCSQKAELRRAQLNGIGRMHMITKADTDTQLSEMLNKYFERILS